MNRVSPDTVIFCVFWRTESSPSEWRPIPPLLRFSPRGSLLSLLTSPELSFDRIYAFDFMEYSGGTFTPILPDSFTLTDTPEYLSWQVGLVWSVLPCLNAELAGVILPRMNKHLLT